MDLNVFFHYQITLQFSHLIILAYVGFAHAHEPWCANNCIFQVIMTCTNSTELCGNQSMSMVTMGTDITKLS